MRALRAVLPTVLAAILVIGGCSAAKPTLGPIDDQVVAVGGELRLTLSATTADGHHVDYTFATNMPNADKRSTLAQRPDGSGLFVMHPLAADVGKWAFDFTASDGSGGDTQTIQIEVKSAVGGATKPLFRSPLGQGTMLDLTSQHCVSLDVLIDDADSTEVTIAQEEPLIAGADLVRKDKKSAMWKWCPDDDQQNGDDRYLLRLSASDGDNPKTIINYAVILRKPERSGCTGEAPAITHSPADDETIVNLDILADVTDDVGLKRAPLLFYGESDPGDHPDVAALTQSGGWKQVEMQLASGTPTGATYRGQIPNPVTDQPIGTQADVYYVITATDNDDPTGACDHFTQSATYHMLVTNPGGQGQLGVCEECVHDIQCGGGSDNCIRIGEAQQGYCAKSCTKTADCPSGYSCSDEEVTSVNGAKGKQCVPMGGTCTAAVVSCADDSKEENDTPEQGLAGPTLAPGTYDNLVSCPSYSTFADEDYYKIVVAKDAKVTLSLTGTNASDIDMVLFAEDGEPIEISTNNGSEEGIVSNVKAGTYIIGVGAQPALGKSRVERNVYKLVYTVDAGTTGGSTCTDDGNEPDNDTAHARPQPALWGFVQHGQICSGNDDYFKVEVAEDEDLIVDLTFTQTKATENLDLHLLDKNGVDQTDCSESHPAGCSAFSGQSTDSNEHLEYFVTSNDNCDPLCTFYIVVHGWNGSENKYDLTIDKL